GSVQLLHFAVRGAVRSQALQRQNVCLLRGRSPTCAEREQCSRMGTATAPQGPKYRAQRSLRLDGGATVHPHRGPRRAEIPNLDRRRRGGRPGVGSLGRASRPELSLKSGRGGLKPKRGAVSREGGGAAGKVLQQGGCQPEKGFLTGGAGKSR